MSKNRIRPDAGWVHGERPKGPNGRGLCRRCGAEVPEGRRTFCSGECVDAWKMTSDPAYVRRKVFDRDKGRCCICQIDTELIVDALQEIRNLTDTDWRDRGGRDRLVALHEPLRRLKIALGLEWTGRKSLWDADHIVPVVVGGGECGIENYQTLCVWCHKAKTAKMRKDLSENRGR